MDRLLYNQRREEPSGQSIPNIQELPGHSDMKDYTNKMMEHMTEEGMIDPVALAIFTKALRGKGVRSIGRFARGTAGQLKDAIWGGIQADESGAGEFLTKAQKTAQALLEKGRQAHQEASALMTRGQKLADKVQEKVGGLADKVQEKVGEVQEKVADAPAELEARARGAGAKASSYVLDTPAARRAKKASRLLRRKASNLEGRARGAEAKVKAGAGDLEASARAGASELDHSVLTASYQSPTITMDSEYIPGVMGRNEYSFSGGGGSASYTDSTGRVVGQGLPTLTEEGGVERDLQTSFDPMRIVRQERAFAGTKKIASTEDFRPPSDLQVARGRESMARIDHLLPKGDKPFSVEERQQTASNLAKERRMKSSVPDEFYDEMGNMKHTDDWSPDMKGYMRMPDTNRPNTLQGYRALRQRQGFATDDGSGGESFRTEEVAPGDGASSVEDILGGAGLEKEPSILQQIGSKLTNIKNKATSLFQSKISSGVPVNQAVEEALTDHITGKSPLPKKMFSLYDNASAETKASMSRLEPKIKPSLLERISGMKTSVKTPFATELEHSGGAKPRMTTPQEARMEDVSPDAMERSQGGLDFGKGGILEHREGYMDYKYPNSLAGETPNRIPGVADLPDENAGSQARVADLGNDTAGNVEKPILARPADAVSREMTNSLDRTALEQADPNVSSATSDLGKAVKPVSFGQSYSDLQRSVQHSGFKRPPVYQPPQPQPKPDAQPDAQPDALIPDKPAPQPDALIPDKPAVAIDAQVVPDTIPVKAEVVPKIPGGEPASNPSNLLSKIGKGLEGVGIGEEEGADTEAIATAPALALPGVDVGALVGDVATAGLGALTMGAGWLMGKIGDAFGDAKNKAQSAVAPVFSLGKTMSAYATQFGTEQ